MNTIISVLAAVFDFIHDFWEDKTTHRIVSGILVIVFVLALAAIEMNRQGVLPSVLVPHVSTSHYQAINLAFSLVLILEVISLIFALPGSMSKAVGKQFEILALIFLRNSFKELSKLPEPIDIQGHQDVLWNILAYGGGAVAIFALLGVYLCVLSRSDEKTLSGKTLELFVKLKKSASLLMIVIFFGLGSYDLWLLFNGQPQFEFFHSFYTILIFSDILLVLIAQTFLPQFPPVFRNSGYAFSTLLIRLSLTAPIYYNVLIGISSVIFAIFLTLVYNRFYMARKTL